ncbi:MAG: hypothetical protein ACKVW3_11820 [Phycisphaerales bacterium]
MTTPSDQPAAPSQPPRWGDRNWYGEQDANGVDLSLIRANLRLSTDERLLKGDRGRESALTLRRYARVHGEQQPRTDRNDPAPARG